MRIALIQSNPTAGDVARNLQSLSEGVERALANSARVVVLPELALVGVGARGLLRDEGLLDRADEALVRLQGLLPRDVVLVVGHPVRTQGGLANVALVLRDGEVVARAAKRLLGNDDLVDEARDFVAGTEQALFELDGVSLGVVVGEDTTLMSSLVAHGARAIVSLHSEPFTLQAPARREERFQAYARTLGIPLAVLRTTGGNDSLLHDGQSFVVQPSGEMTRAALFEESVHLETLAIAPNAEIDSHAPDAALPPVPPPPATPLVEELSKRDLEELFLALVTGVRDYFAKSGFTQALIGLSGGIDSALVAAIAAKALGGESVRGVALPSRFTEDVSNADAALLARNLGMPFQSIPIEKPFGSFLDALAPAFEGRAWDVTEENLQARIRGDILMALSNKTGALLLTTGNRSETAVGYCTLYGDMCGALAVIADVPKTIVWALSRHINERAGIELIPARTIERPPSAELREGQRDEDTLPDYPTLDRILRRLVDLREDADSCARNEPDLARATIERVERLVRLSEYKRRQAAPPLRVTRSAFGHTWRRPLAHRLS